MERFSLFSKTNRVKFINPQGRMKMKEAMLEKLYKTLSKDFCCETENFINPGLYITKFSEKEGRRKFPVSSKHFSFISINNSLVVCTAEKNYDWCLQSFEGMSKQDFFSPQNMVCIEEKIKEDGSGLRGPEFKFICEATQTERPLKTDYMVDIYYKDEIHKLYRFKNFQNALTYKKDLQRDDEIALTITHRGKIIAIAGASSDSEDLWQIGLDVKEKYRDMGIGKFLLNLITKNIIKLRKIPYYSTTVWNIPSMNLALYSGYKLLWVEYYSGEICR
jgi:hypothetical protein